MFLYHYFVVFCATFPLLLCRVFGLDMWLRNGLSIVKPPSFRCIVVLLSSPSVIPGAAGQFGWYEFNGG